MNRLRNILRTLWAGVLLRLSRHHYWAMRAKDIDAAYGHDTGDFATIETVLSRVHPKKILDIGCGTGRLFPVYLRHPELSVVGQEISAWAVKTARQRFPQPVITFDQRALRDLAYPDGFFDLTISNRVLSAIPSKELPAVLKNIVRQTSYLYLNEFSDSDDGQPSAYWFRHDYLPLLKNFCTYSVALSGTIGKQSYYLLKIESLQPSA